jgi:hydroxymethylbilane synthase
MGIMAEKTLRVGTRPSDLALWQARRVVALICEARPQVECDFVEITTRGDWDRETPLHLAGGVGFFVKGLELALLDDEIDAAVHSLKDLPSRVPPGLALAAVPERGNPYDALVSASGAALDDLPEGARVGTGSPRRKAQLLRRRSDLRVVGIRGNVDTRLEKLRGPEYDAVVLAAAGLERLGRAEAITETLGPETMLPAAGQGSLAVEIRADDEHTRDLIAAVNHAPSWAAANAERALMARLGAGCHVPAAAYAVLDGDALWLRALVASHDGQELILAEARGTADDPRAVGYDAADDLLARGAAALLEA